MELVIRSFPQSKLAGYLCTHISCSVGVNCHNFADSEGIAKSKYAPVLGLPAKRDSITHALHPLGDTAETIEKIAIILNFLASLPPERGRMICGLRHLKLKQ